MALILFCPDLLTYWRWFSQSDESVIIKGEFSVPRAGLQINYSMIVIRSICFCSRQWDIGRLHDCQTIVIHSMYRDRQTPSLLLHVRMNDTQSPLLCRFVRYCFLHVCMCKCSKSRRFVFQAWPEISLTHGQVMMTYTDTDTASQGSKMSSHNSRQLHETPPDRSETHTITRTIQDK